MLRLYLLSLTVTWTPETDQVMKTPLSLCLTVWVVLAHGVQLCHLGRRKADLMGARAEMQPFISWPGHEREAGLNPINLFGDIPAPRVPEYSH